MGLNPNQERSLAVTLRGLERALDQIELMLERDQQGVLYVVRTGLPPERVELLRKLSTATREVIASLAEQYHLAPQQMDGARVISAVLSSAWESLEDVHPKKLNRYGAVDPALMSELGPSIERLIELVLAMEGLTR
jgi:hypothetical protein